MVAWLENITTAAFTVFAFALFAIAMRAWFYSRSQKVLFLATGFGLMFAKGIMLSIILFTSPSWGESALLPSLVLDLGVLGLFYLAVLKRSS